ncbi:MAG: dihydrofolate reductase [Rhodocyclaceae bacterium]
MIVIVAAVARNGVIGKNDTLPWRLSEDLKHFKALTTGHAVVMGRKTWESLPAKFRPLPQRQNYVVTRDPHHVAPGATVLHSLEEVRKIGAGETALFVIGGAELYRQMLPWADRLEITEIDAAFDGDAFFPDIDRRQWREVRREPGVATGGLRYAFVTYERANRAA